VKFAVADALALPYPDGAVRRRLDRLRIRNVDDPLRCLREMARVVKQGAR